MYKYVLGSEMVKGQISFLATIGLLKISLDGMIVHVLPNNLQVLSNITYTSGWRQFLEELSVWPKNAMQWLHS